MIESNNNDRKLIYLSIGIATIIVIGWLSTYYFLGDKEERGSFGDMFGSINALYSGLALAGIIITILLQRKELMLQRQELIETRKELSRSADAQEKLELQQKRQAENLKITAKLNALNSLLSYYTAEQNTAHELDSLVFAKTQKEECVKKIKEILNLKET